MSNLIAVENRANLSTDEFAQMQSVLETQTTMERALKWFFGQVPALNPEDLITQDEFSFDLLVPYHSSLYLSYDTS